MKDITRFSLVLFSICLVAGFFLSLISGIAQPRILAQKEKEENQAIEDVLPAAPYEIEKVQKDNISFYKAKDEKGNLIAYVFIAQPQGYSSRIKTVVSLDKEGNIITVKVLEQAETPGIGSRVAEEDFLSRFKGKSFNQSFDTITGATISSQAVIDAIKEKAQILLSHGE